jgi:hypothetical protein
MQSSCDLVGGLPWGWGPSRLHIQVRFVSAVVFVVSHELFKFKFTVKTSKSILCKGFPRYIHPGTWDGLKAQPSKDLKFFGGLSTDDKSWKAMFDGLLK